MLSFDDATNRLRTYGSEDLSKLFMDLEFSAAGVEPWPATFLQIILALLGDRTFLQLQDSWRLIYFINNAWELLTGEQRDRLRRPLEDAFEEYRDWMGAFITAEVLGEKYGDREALAALSRLGRTAKAPARALAPHGLEAVARESPNQELRDLAISELRELKDPENDEVKREAVLSLNNLGIEK